MLNPCRLNVCQRHWAYLETVADVASHDVEGTSHISAYCFRLSEAIQKRTMQEEAMEQTPLPYHVIVIVRAAPNPFHNSSQRREEERNLSQWGEPNDEEDRWTRRQVLVRIYEAEDPEAERAKRGIEDIDLEVLRA